MDELSPQSRDIVEAGGPRSSNSGAAADFRLPECPTAHVNMARTHLGADTLLGARILELLRIRSAQLVKPCSHRASIFVSPRGWGVGDKLEGGWGGGGSHRAAQQGLTTPSPSVIDTSAGRCKSQTGLNENMFSFNVPYTGEGGHDDGRESHGMAAALDRRGRTVRWRPLRRSAHGLGSPAGTAQHRR